VKQCQGLFNTTLATQFLGRDPLTVGIIKKVDGRDCVEATCKLHNRADMHFQPRMSDGLFGLLQFFGLELWLGMVTLVRNFVLLGDVDGHGHAFQAVPGAV
jgi:hypothetical protein